MFECFTPAKWKNQEEMFVNTYNPLKLNKEDLNNSKRSTSHEIEIIIKTLSTKKSPPGHQWLMSVILATQEAEIKRIMI
jgi:hypothetical protein